MASVTSYASSTTQGERDSRVCSMSHGHPLSLSRSMRIVSSMVLIDDIRNRLYLHTWLDEILRFQISAQLLALFLDKNQYHIHLLHLYLHAFGLLHCLPDEGFLQLGILPGSQVSQAHLNFHLQHAWQQSQLIWLIQFRKTFLLLCTEVLERTQFERQIVFFL